MSDIQIITDSTAYIDKSFVEEHNIKVVPLTVHFEEKIENEPFPGEFDSFFDRLAKSSDFPKTSQPSAGLFKEVFEEALQDEKEIIVLTISSKLSGTFNSASTAANLTDPNKISVIDSETTASNLMVLVKMAVELSEKGVSRNEIVDQLEKQKKRMRIRLTVGSLEYLKRGGRLSNTSALIGSLLNIKPIIDLIDGKLEPVGKVRGRKKALEAIIEDIPEETSVINICHIFALDEAHEIKSILLDRYPLAKVDIQELGPVVGSHLGPKALGVCYMY